jgi:large subunit ribosomal protein L2
MRYVNLRGVGRMREDGMVSLPMKHIISGTEVHNIEIVPGKGPVYCKAAGSKAFLYRAEKEGYVRIDLPSGESRFVPEECIATLGSSSASEQKHTVIGMAGRKRRKGFKPRVRGVAMNPIDHPHGGGEKRTSGGRPNVSK